MATNPLNGVQSAPGVSQTHRNAVLDVLRDAAMTLVNAQFAEFTDRLAGAFMQLSEVSSDAKQANLSFNVANLLKNHGYPFFHIGSAAVRDALKREIDMLEFGVIQSSAQRDAALSLVPYAEMDNRVLLGTVARVFDIENAEQLTALNIRLASVLERDSLNVAQNPFRPEVFLGAIHAAWCDFDPDAESHSLILPLLRPEVFLELPVILKSLNDTLVARGVLPELVSAYRIRKSDGNLSAATKEANDSALRQQLRRMFAPESTDDAGGTSQSNASDPGNTGGSEGYGSSRPPGVNWGNHSSAKLFQYLAKLQRSANAPSGGTGNLGGAPELPLSQIKMQMPKGSLSRIDETTIDLLTQIFETVFEDQHIPAEIKQLIGILQVPVLKAALIDKDFFYTETHPARRLIDLLTRSSVGWDQTRGVEDPLYQMIQRTVAQVQRDDNEDAGGSVSFTQAVSNLESYIHEEEVASTTALEAPITQALHHEKIRTATKSAKLDVAVRIGTGEVVPFVEAFLESRWVPVLTLAHSISDEKPEVLTNAIKTMDDLLWSVKPKVTSDTRKDLISRLPAILSMLNKWLNVIKWDDADRLQFFADLAECHASIVRAPLELTPDRQIEIAVEVAKKAAERRLEKRAAEVPEPEPDAFEAQVYNLQRGAWLQFDQPDGSQKTVKLAWVSPLRTLYIFSTSQRQEAFSIAAELLAEQLRGASARCLELDGMVDRALSKALEYIEVDEVELHH